MRIDLQPGHVIPGFAIGTIMGAVTRNAPLQMGLACTIIAAVHRITHQIFVNILCKAATSFDLQLKTVLVLNGSFFMTSAITLVKVAHSAKVLSTPVAVALGGFNAALGLAVVLKAK